MNRNLVFAIAILLTACQTTSYEGNENSPYYLVPVGSTLKLTRDLSIPAHQVAVYLQGGEVVPPERINQYYPHCKFELIQRRDTAQPVKPDTFEITQVVQEIGHSVALEGVKIARVSVGVGVHIGIRGGDGTSIQAYSTRMKLRSANQPDVFRLSCGHTPQTHDLVHLTINEMRKALGGVITLDLAGRKPQL